MEFPALMSGYESAGNEIFLRNGSSGECGGFSWSAVCVVWGAIKAKSKYLNLYKETAKDGSRGISAFGCGVTVPSSISAITIPDNWKKKCPKLVINQQHLAEQQSLDKSLSSHRVITIVSWKFLGASDRERWIKKLNNDFFTWHSFAWESVSEFAWEFKIKIPTSSSWRHRVINFCYANSSNHRQYLHCCFENTSFTTLFKLYPRTPFKLMNVKAMVSFDIRLLDGTRAKEHHRVYYLVHRLCNSLNLLFVLGMAAHNERSRSLH